MTAGAEEARKHIKVYLGVLGALAVLTVVTVSAAGLQTGIIVGVAIAMLIAVVKGSLVAGFFMHLLYDRKGWLYGLLVLCFVFFVVLMLLPVLSVEETRLLENVP